MRLLVTRPLPGGEATAARLAAHGHDAIVAPLMAAEALPWQLPTAPPQAVMLTSAFAARLAGAAAFHALPCFVVGAATAKAAKLAGFGDIRDGGGTAQALLATAAAAGITELLHLAGEDRTPVVIPVGLAVETRTVYRARLLPLKALPAIDWVLLYSARSAGHFAAECDRLGVDRAMIAIAGLSVGIIAAAGRGWRATMAAPQPYEDALLAAIGATCHKAGPQP
jgi:uroporphyrinogen-III synthase